MPVLSSGLSLAISKDHIMPPDRNWFRAPEGHFWFWVPDEDSIPPFTSGDVVMRKPATAPVPTSRKEMLCFIHVMFQQEDGCYYWRGETLDVFPLYSRLSDEDRTAWQEWLASDQVLSFIDQAMIDCQVQAEINKEAVGWAAVRADSSDPDEDGFYRGLKEIDNPLKGAH
jgi:hypothetical protein